MNIDRNREHHAINHHGHSYIQIIFAEFKMEQSRQVATPMAMKLNKMMPDTEACDPSIYQSMIQCLMYGMTATWPDIAMPSEFSAGTLRTEAFSICSRSCASFSSLTVQTTSDSASVGHWKQQAHLDGTSIQTILDVQMTTN
jgi:hypothetical protein